MIFTKAKQWIDNEGLVANSDNPKLIRITTVPSSLKTLLKGQHRFMSSHFEVIGVSSAGEALKDVEKDEGVRVVPVEMTRTISPFKDLKSLWQLYLIFC